jgi:hypothetical protein
MAVAGPVRACRGGAGNRDVRQDGHVVQGLSRALQMDRQGPVAGPCADRHRLLLAVDDKGRINVTEVDAIARRISDAVEGMTGSDRAGPGSPGDNGACLVDRGRAVDAVGGECVIARPIALACHVSACVTLSVRLHARVIGLQRERVWLDAARASPGASLRGCAGWARHGERFQFVDQRGLRLRRGYRRTKS